MSIRRTAGSLLVLVLLVIATGSVPARAAPGDPEGPTNPGRCSSVTAGDYDGDGLSNSYECQIGTSAVLADTDRDGIKDPLELEIGTDPTNPNTDGDAWKDGCERSWQSTIPAINPAVYNNDSDGDGLPDALETWGGTDPWANDTDDDVLRDGDEWHPCYGKSGDSDGPEVALDPDWDEDGILDGIEVISTGTNRFRWDTDGDGWSDSAELYDYGTDPLDPTDKPSGYPPGHP